MELLLNQYAQWNLIEEGGGAVEVKDMTLEQLLIEHRVAAAGCYTAFQYNRMLVAEKEIRERVGRLEHGQGAQPKCPRCGEPELRFTEHTDLVGWMGKMLCESGKCQGEFSYYDIEDWTDFAQFYKPAAPPEQPRAQPYAAPQTCPIPQNCPVCNPADPLPDAGKEITKDGKDGKRGTHTEKEGAE